jgi:hypothetical protein
MALEQEPIAAPPVESNESNEKKHDTGLLETDHENQGGRRMSRIDKKDPNVDYDDSSGLSVGQQIEMEKGNAIKYRSCSWRKV